MRISIWIYVEIQINIKYNDNSFAKINGLSAESCR